MALDQRLYSVPGALTAPPAGRPFRGWRPLVRRAGWAGLLLGFLALCYHEVASALAVPRRFRLVALALILVRAAIPVLHQRAEEQHERERDALRFSRRGRRPPAS